MHKKDTANNALLEPSWANMMGFLEKTVNDLLFWEAATSDVL